MSHAANLQPGDVLADTWRIESVLREGQSGPVFLATDLRLGRQVAVKALDATTMDEDAVARLEREAALLARLSHPNIVSLHTMDRHEGVPYLVLQFVEGQTLAERVLERGGLSLREVLTVADQACDALAYLHAQGLLHRDLKPSNLMISRQGHLTLIDLGITRTHDSTLTRTGVVHGTPGYMSPEAILGEKHLDGRADQYSLAAVLFELLTGSPPFSGLDGEALLRAHLSQPRPKAHELRRTLPPAVSAVLARAMALQPDGRYASVRDFHAAFRAALEPAVEASAAEEAATLPGREALRVPGPSDATAPMRAMEPPVDPEAVTAPRTPLARPPAEPLRPVDVGAPESAATIDAAAPVPGRSSRPAAPEPTRPLSSRAPGEHAHPPQHSRLPVPSPSAQHAPSVPTNPSRSAPAELSHDHDAPDLAGPTRPLAPLAPEGAHPRSAGAQAEAHPHGSSTAPERSRHHGSSDPAGPAHPGAPFTPDAAHQHASSAPADHLHPLAPSAQAEPTRPLAPLAPESAHSRSTAHYGTPTAPERSRHHASGWAEPARPDGPLAPDTAHKHGTSAPADNEHARASSVQADSTSPPTVAPGASHSRGSPVDVERAPPHASPAAAEPTRPLAALTPGGEHSHASSVSTERPRPAPVESPHPQRTRSGERRATGPLPEVDVTPRGLTPLRRDEYASTPRPFWRRRPFVVWGGLMAGAVGLSLLAIFWPSDAPVGPPPPEALPMTVLGMAPPPPPPAPKAQQSVRTTSATAEEIQARHEAIPVVPEKPRPHVRRGTAAAPQRILMKGGLRPLKTMQLGEVLVIATFDEKPVAALVEVDGVLKGQTPITLSLPPGTHVLRLDYPRAMVTEFATHFLPGKATRLEVELPTAAEVARREAINRERARGGHH
ncbi:MAG: protein kinase [Myxococcaceae bacterium]|nr:protein kinase [Myxococcaceae bacterium]